MKKKGRMTVTNIGTSSMFVILFGLCFTVLAALAIVVANHDYRMNEALAAHTTAYYNACNLAEEKLLDMEQLYQTADEDGYAAFSVPVWDGQELAVEMHFAGSANDYEITKWQIVNTGDWNGDTALPVLQEP